MITWACVLGDKRVFKHRLNCVNMRHGTHRRSRYLSVASKRKCVGISSCRFDIICVKCVKNCGSLHVFVILPPQLPPLPLLLPFYAHMNTYHLSLVWIPYASSVWTFLYSSFLFKIETKRRKTKVKSVALFTMRYYILFWPIIYFRTVGHRKFQFQICAKKPTHGNCNPTHLFFCHFASVR